MIDIKTEHNLSDYEKARELGLPEGGDISTLEQS
jgi:hypothetical protein